MQELRKLLNEAADERQLSLLVLSGPRANADAPAERITIRPVEVGGELRYQLSVRQGSRETHENLTSSAMIERVLAELAPSFRECNVFTNEFDAAVQVRDDGALRIRRRPPSRSAGDARHNRAKRRLIPEGAPSPFLVELGVMTPQGKVRAAQQHKFRQINRYLEFVNDVIDGLPSGRPLSAVDLGCGKSYLTFALYHLLTQVHQREVVLVGIDLNAELIERCNRLAAKLGCDGLHFQVGQIGGFEPAGKVDLVVSLHACDTATDDALAAAVRWKAEVILAAPCCQHELAAQLGPESWHGMARHGVIRQRLAALATDALRAELLELCGYKTQVLEFIDLEHTAKNLLIRARARTDAPPGLASRSRRRYLELKRELGFADFRLEQLLSARLELPP